MDDLGRPAIDHSFSLPKYFAAKIKLFSFMDKISDEIVIKSFFFRLLPASINPANQRDAKKRLIKISGFCLLLLVLSHSIRCSN